MSEQTRYTCRLGDMEITFINRSLHRGDWREYEAAPRMYVDVKDETLIENINNRRMRPYNLYKTLIHTSALGTLLNLGNLKWSQRAGCSCPCSPGFILPSQTVNIGGHSFRYFDVWINVTSKAPAELAVR